MCSFLLHFLFFIFFGLLVKNSLDKARSKVLEIDLSNLILQEREPLEGEKMSFGKKLSRSKDEKKRQAFKNVESSKISSSNFEGAKDGKVIISEKELSEEVIKIEKRKNSLDETKEDSLFFEKVVESFSTLGYQAREPLGTIPSKVQVEKPEGGERITFHKARSEAEVLYLSQKLLVISEIMQKNLTYPYLARKMGWQGDLLISFILTPSGELKDVKIEKSTGYEILDRQAKETLLKVVKYFPKPEVEVSVKLPVKFRLEGP